MGLLPQWIVPDKSLLVAESLLFEVSQVLFRLSRWENLEYAKKI